MTDESKKLLALLKQLDVMGISHVLVGEQAQELAQHVKSDVDIVVSHANLSRLNGALETVCADLDMQLVQVLQHEHCAFYYVVSWLNEGNRCYLCLDVCSDYVRYGRNLLSAREMLKEKVHDPSGTFFMPGPGKNFIYYLLKKVDKGAINQDQFTFLADLYDDAGETAGAELESFWGGDDTSVIRNYLDQRNLTLFQQRIPALRQVLRSGVRVSFAGYFKEAMRRLSRICRPTGVWISILGPDGCGKSSVIENLLPDIKPAFRRTGLMHFRPKVGYRGPADDSNAANPHDQQDRSRAGSILKLGYYAADYIFGYFLKVLPARIRSTFLVFDRYYDDLLVDQKRYCYSGPAWLLRTVGLFIPKPDLVFCLDAPAEVLQARKQEVPFEVTARQREAYCHLVSNLPNGHVIDASQPLTKVVFDVESTILSFMAERTEKRMSRS